MIIGIDPGRDKCGLVLVKEENQIVVQTVVETNDLINRIKELDNDYNIDRIIIGDGTLSSEIVERIRINYNSEVKIEVIDETGSTLEARELYWQENPPKNWRRLIPISFQTPPRPIDDYAALVLVKRFLAKSKE
ncbi:MULTISPECIES: pre-16S rRNA-processing nuclease YqgF [unclassified Candidatus Frackibacter]|uniref:pre-16S rRNA-processing nuclease YqgF n=1 Tax=unclassified Candidatus Frackibacter TaxID=2648818 RepID=UPI0008908454|nr:MULTISPECIES: pre-16S rRNA-processing nuclease YqgF [unclassified Candidatus Frackibacter]SDC09018.1 RNase H-fold protein, predicted Holliday junction resolvase [Candidatus Frackibacter sp. WG11]SEM37994.1 RNase H-fold protein, predicted Holliday junction resolvase [Candidatus Frackibacter sp. WG12]SFL43486.1 RNase H-fold protein, predicted Holliday junction resolvase [Candidatus Frackibacter sp. WG13]